MPQGPRLKNLILCRACAEVTPCHPAAWSSCGRVSGGDGCRQCRLARCPRRPPGTPVQGTRIYQRQTARGGLARILTQRHATVPSWQTLLPRALMIEGMQRQIRLSSACKRDARLDPRTSRQTGGESPVRSGQSPLLRLMLSLEAPPLVWILDAETRNPLTCQAHVSSEDIVPVGAGAAHGGHGLRNSQGHD